MNKEETVNKLHEFAYCMFCIATLGIVCLIRITITIAVRKALEQHKK